MNEKPLGTLVVACSLNERASVLEGAELADGLTRRHISFHSPAMMQERGLELKDIDCVLLSPGSRAFFRRLPAQPLTLGEPTSHWEQVNGRPRRLIDIYMDLKKPIVVLDPEGTSMGTYPGMIVCKSWWDVFQEIVKIQARKGMART